MKYRTITTALLASFALANAEIIQFEISPPGTDSATGLSPDNEVPAPAVASTGSGDELFNGITFDTDTSMLTFVFGYGSAVAFTDLTGPVTGLHIHGPAAVGETANVVFPLTAFHFPNSDPAKGGIVLGAIQYNDDQKTDLLAGKHYINLHTADNGPGEIRGHIRASHRGNVK